MDTTTPISNCPLVILIEGFHPFLNSSNLEYNELSLQSYIEQVLMFVRAYTLMNEEKHLAIFEVDIDGTRFLCNNASHETSRHGPSKQYKDIAEVVLDRMRQVAANLKLESSLNKENAHKVRWSAALLRALCYVNKYCGAGRPGHGGGQEPRILCIVASPDDSSEYLAMMNGIFAAQRREIVIDACVLNNSHSSFMQQACFLTKGIYLHPRHPQALLQYLMTALLSEPSSREFLRLPEANEVDFKASCFCHHRHTSLGYVCSVCLSVYCQQVLECSTCGTEFSEA